MYFSCSKIPWINGRVHMGKAEMERWWKQSPFTNVKQVRCRRHLAPRVFLLVWTKGPCRPRGIEDHFRDSWGRWPTLGNLFLSTCPCATCSASKPGDTGKKLNRMLFNNSRRSLCHLNLLIMTPGTRWLHCYNINSRSLSDSAKNYSVNEKGALFLRLASERGKELILRLRFRPQASCTSSPNLVICTPSYSLLTTTE